MKRKNIFLITFTLIFCLALFNITTSYAYSDSVVKSENSIDKLTRILGYFIYGILIIGGVAFVGIYFWKRSKGKKKSKNAEVNIKSVKKCDVSDYVNIDDIKGGMIIKNNYRKFTAGVRTNGVDFFDSTPREQSNIIQNYISYISSVSTKTKLFVQATADDIDCYLHFFDGITQKRTKEMEAIYDELQELHKTYDSLSEIETKRMVKKEIRKKEKMLKNLEWIIKRNEAKKQLVKTTTPEDVRDKFESTIFVDYIHNDVEFGYELKDSEIMKRAKQELEPVLKNIIRGHANCGVSCEMLDSNDIAQCLRTTFNPFVGDVYKIEDALKSDMFTYAATSDNEKTVKMKALLKELKEGEKKVG